ncbi:hypothetical protein EU520_01060 [Candidatus Thorarchaeota archaeon]|nr:MAG: hypothetical protein EU520_01060 [Candidatus Thorarchaeota archaeon]
MICDDSREKAITILVLSLLLLGFPQQVHYMTTSESSLVSSDSIQDQDSIDSAALITQSTVRILDTDVSVYNTPEALQGLNLFVVVQSNKTTGEKSLFLLITDMEGNVEKQRYLGNHSLLADVPAEFINSTTILTGDDTGALLWNIYSDETEHLGFRGHHEFEYNANNNSFFTLHAYVRHVNDTDYLYDKIVEYDENGNYVWGKHTGDFIEPSQWCPYEDRMGDTIDLVHSNTVFYDHVEDIIYFNARNVNTFYKIDHATGDVVWGLGEYGNFTLFDLNGTQRENLFYHAHAVEKIDDNRFIIFDNDYHNQTNPDSRVSAMREITVNETTMTANVTWQWNAPETYWSMIWGDADRLANGNRLGVFGKETHVNTARGPRLAEVDEEGSVVWEMGFQLHSDYSYGIYRMERFRYSPILSSPVDVGVLEGEDVIVSWNTWYNFRPKREITGEYELLVNGKSHAAGDLVYDPYWRPRELTANIGPLSAGIHNVTLITTDEGGHTSSDSVTVTVAGFWLERSGPLVVEVGEEQHMLEWTGDTLTPLQCEILVDAEVFTSFEWTGEGFSLDLFSLDIGIHAVELEMSNSSGQIHYEQFSVTVYPAEPPVIHSRPDDSAIPWNSTPQLSWTFADNRPSEWRIYIDDGLHISDTWGVSPYTLNWSVPVLDEGVHNITLSVRDRADHRATDSLEVEVTAPSPPIISGTPDPTTLIWGRDDVVLNWEVHGGEEYELWRNGSLRESGPLESTVLSIPIESWQAERWRPGTYNLTLVVSDAVSTVSHTSWITVILDPGDPYADAVVPSLSSWYLHGENALGAPDGEYASIYLDYANGFLTLDMGESEEVLDGPGDDFSVLSQSGEYRVSVADSISSAFTSLGRSEGNTSFDLLDFGVEGFRYVRVEFYSGNQVLLDAIVAYNVNVPTGDTSSPLIEAVEDVVVYDNVPSVSVTWNATDETPWSYLILLNGTEVESGYWNGSDITYVLATNKTGSWNVTLILEDLMGNTASSCVLVDIKPFMAAIFESPLFVIALISATGLITVLLLLGYRRMRKKG